MHNLKFPTNIKQIGNIDENFRIYIEDYVYTYLQQYSASAGYNEQIAILIGKHTVVENQNVLFVTGAIQAKFTQYENGIMNLTQKTFEYVNKEIEKYFYNDLEILGWMQSQPGYGIYLNEKYKNHFTENFKEEYQVMFVMDPMEKANSFYTLDNEKAEFKQSSGYFIYYEKNEAMNDYIISNKPAKKNTEDENQDELEKKNEPPEIILRRRQIERIKKNNSEQKKITNMLVSLSAILFVICFIMGAGLVQNEERIASLEKKLISVSSSYKEMIDGIKQENAEAVFASQNELEKANKILEEIKAMTTPTPLPTPQSVTPTPIVQAEPSLKKVPDTYTVQSGDNLSFISQKIYGTNKMVEKIMEENKLDDPDKIFVGKVLKLPES